MWKVEPLKGDIPQGSVLGSLLFVVYIIDLPGVSNELISTDIWLMATRLTLNVEKNCDTHSVLRTNNENFGFVEFTKYLGVFYDRKPTFTKHIETICKKLSKNVGLLYSISLFFPGFIQERLYYPCVFPYMSYFILIWGGAADTQIEQIFKLQKLAVRIIRKPSTFSTQNFCLYS